MPNTTHTAYHLPSRYHSSPLSSPSPSPSPSSERGASVNPGAHSIQLVDLMLGAHDQVTESEVDFTLAMLGAVTVFSNNPYHPIPSKFAKRALRSPGLIRALADSPDLRADVSELSDGLAFECMVKRIVFQFCVGACALTNEAYAEAVDYLEGRPDELYVKHEHYLVAHELHREEVRVAKMAEERRLRREKVKAAMKLKMFKTKSKKRKGPIVIRRVE